MLAAIEVLAAAAVILLDVGIPTLVVLAVAGLSLVLRRQGPASIGFTRLPAPVRTVGVILVLTVGWSLVEFGLLMPILNRLTHSRQDFSVFADLEGNVGLLIALLVASWTLAAVGEEAVFRGYLPSRLRTLCGAGTWATVVTVLVPAALFAAIHSEQGQVGVALTFLDALFFTFLRVRFGSVWAAVLAHGFSNTLGICTFFLVGPIHGLW